MAAALVAAALQVAACRLHVSAQASGAGGGIACLSALP